MNIYDYVLYGVNEGEYMKNGQKELVIYPTKEAAWGKHINCQIVLLKSYQGEKDVLMFQWWNGRVQFVTLSGMYAFLRRGWTGIGAEDPLAIYAKKCCIEEGELMRDAYSLLEVYDDMSIEDINRFTEDDVKCALEMYNEDYVTFPRDDIAKLSGLQIEKNKRNGRKQAEHVKLMNFVRDEINGNVNWRAGNGRKSKKNVIMEYMRENPGITKKAAIARAVGADRNTVIKYYDEIVAELQQERLRAERLEQLERDGHIAVKITPSQKLSDYILGELKK